MKNLLLFGSITYLLAHICLSKPHGSTKTNNQYKNKAEKDDENSTTEIHLLSHLTVDGFPAKAFTYSA